MKLGTDYLTGTLDRMYSNSKDSWEIIDYKTNKVSKAELPHIISGYSVQSETYALLISHLFPNQSEYRVNFYFIHPDQLLSNVYTVEETRKLAAKFLTTLSAMKKLHDQNSTL
jgi:hypothetical protein